MAPKAPAKPRPDYPSGRVPQNGSKGIVRKGVNR
jgi:hypothetical protein